MRDLAVLQYALCSESLSFDCLSRIPQLRQFVILHPGLGCEMLQSFPSMPQLETLSIEGCCEISSDLFQVLASKFPQLKSLTIGCDSEASLAKDFGAMPDLASLKELKLINCYRFSDHLLRDHLRDTVNLSSRNSPDDVLQKQVEFGFEDVHRFLQSASLLNFPQVPLSGEYFTPSHLTQLALDRRFDILKLLVAYGADIDYGNPILAYDVDTRYDCSTALHFVVHRGDEQGQSFVLDFKPRFLDRRKRAFEFRSTCQRTLF